MKKDSQHLIDKTKSEERKLPCQKCDNITYHTVMCSINKREDNEYTWYEHDYEIVMCMGCREVSFRSNWIFSEDEEYDPETGFSYCVNHEELFPNRIVGRKEIKDRNLLPQEILKIYKETHIAITYNAPVLAGVGIRALVEAICKDRGAVGTDLEKKIDNLVDLKILTKEGAEILHSTRIMGNKAAHELTASDEKDLEIAMNLVEHVLLGFYILPKKAESLPKRNSN